MGNMKANRKFVEGEEAVSAVIGVILMVAITVAIAATVYMYVSGMIGGGLKSTPSISMSATPNAARDGAMITVSTITEAGVNWSAVDYTLANVTAGTQMKSGNFDLTFEDTVSGGDIITVSATGNVTATLAATFEYSLTLSYTTTGGTLGSVSWTE